MAVVNPELVRERKRATFDPLLLTHLLYNGSQETRRKRYIEALASEDPHFKNGPPVCTLTREEFYDASVKQTMNFYRQTKELGLTKPIDLFHFTQVYFSELGNPAFLHEVAFLPTIISQGTEEQKAKWLPLGNNYQIFGTYAQTEIGHGSNIRGLETTAVYDATTEEFVLNSPTLTSIKFWPGGLAKLCNICVVAAQLYTRGKHHGLQFFIVPLRDFDTHETLPGVTVGDIGTKFSFGGIDNGFLKLESVRIPRNYMLMRHSQVLMDGTFVKPKNPKMAYGSMTSIRAALMNAAAFALAKGCTIAIRYSAVRRQVEITPGGKEAQVLDYQTQQFKLLPCLATAYAFWFSGKFLQTFFHQVTKEMDKGAMEQLPQLHMISAGLKAFGTWTATSMLETLRMSCGGHGFSGASAFAALYQAFCAACTYEGEHTVLLLQTARFLMKCFSQVKQGQQLTGFVSYLNRPLEGSRCSLSSDLSLSSLVDMYEHRAHRLIAKAAESIEHHLTRGKTVGHASNQSGVMLCQAAMGHCHMFVLKMFVDKVHSKDLDTDVKNTLHTLCQLYAVYGIHKNLGDFLEDGYMSRQQTELVDKKLYELLADVRNNAVALVDAFDIPDVVLNSALGRFDGNVYDALLGYAKQSKLNESEVHDSYYKYLKPFMQSMKLKVDPEILSRL
ncbi:peroxisomal acyl-coenzyme A oxidase 1-like [Gigantopelta aegis]|uniref:peroxisomal acyl-coenzyme A oxidase 1-like n=1 Tax=Gigantopelta aegis TaxID=1735272 RepID=UPI001B888666|nr:peroxisomal acyl-coenzyme A oxidase 1-like [Gigantopelta aegis]